RPPPPPTPFPYTTLFRSHRDRLRSVTPEDVARVAATYFKPSNRTLGLFVPTPKPDRAEIPATPDLQAALHDYKGDALVAAGEARSEEHTSELQSQSNLVC